MHSVIIPTSTTAALSKVDDSGFILVSAPPLSGKTSILKAWLEQVKRPALYIDFNQQAPELALKRELERTLEKAIDQPNAIVEPAEDENKDSDSDNSSAARPVHLSGVLAQALSFDTPLKDNRLIVLLDHLPLRDALDTDSWLCSIIERYSGSLLFVITSETKPSVTLLRLTFEHSGLMLDQSNLEIGLDDLVAQRHAHQWKTNYGELAAICEKAKNNNLVLLHLLNKKLKKNQQLPLPDTEAWLKITLQGFDTAEIACIKLLSQLNWTLPGLLTLIMPKHVSQDFSETLSTRLWIDEYTHNSQRLIRLKQQIKIGLDFFTAKLPGIVFKPAHFWLIDTLYKNYLPESDILKTWISLEKPDFVKQLLNKLHSNGKLKHFVESSSLLTLNDIPQEILVEFPTAQATIYARAINSCDAASVNKHHKLWEAYDLSRDKQPTPNGNPIASEAIILSAADKILFSDNKARSFNPVSPLSQIPRWLEISSRLLLTHTVCSLMQRPPEQKTFLQLEQIALRAANEQDFHTALDTLKVLALLTQRFGFHECYIKVSRYLSDFAKHFEAYQQAQNELLKVIQQPVALMSKGPEHPELDHAYANPQILDSAASALLLYTGYAFHYAWQNNWEVTLGFLETAEGYFRKLSEPVKQYCPSPLFLSQLIALLSSQGECDISEPQPDEHNSALALLIQGLLLSQKESFISAEQNFEKARSLMQEQHFRSELIWHDVTVCYYWMHRGDKKKALLALEDMFKHHEQTGVTLPLALLGKHLKPLLEYGNQQRSMQTEHIKLCTKAFPFLFEESDASPTISSLLSKREYEILHYMSEGSSNEEISKLLHRSVGTIKLHAHNIYKKLKVKNRVEAINLYKQAGLLDGNPNEGDN